jgi:hypothetical protein
MPIEEHLHKHRNLLVKWANMSKHYASKQTHKATHYVIKT